MAVWPHQGKEPPLKLNFSKELALHRKLKMNALVGDGSYSGIVPYENKRRGTWKNFVILCLSTFLSFVAVFPSRNLQTSIHSSYRMGTISLCALYGFYIIGCLTSNICIQHFRAKCLLLVALIFHVLYSVSNVIPSMYTLIPASCLLGLCQPLFWSIQEITLLGYALNYSAFSNINLDSSLRLFQTLIVITVHSAQILGNLLSSGLLSLSDVDCADIWSNGYTNGTELQEVGAFAKSERWTYTLPLIPVLTRKLSDHPGPINYYQFLTVLYLCLGVVAMGGVLIFFESPDILLKRRSGTWKEKIIEVKDTVCDAKAFLAGFAAIFTGYIQGVIIADILKQYGTDVFGCFIVGYMMMCFGTGNLASILAFDKLKQYGLSAISLSAGFILNTSILITAFVWRPTSSQSTALLIYLALWGAGDGIIQSQLQLAIPKYIPKLKETALIALRVCNGIGLELSFIVSLTLNNLMTSLYIAMALHLIGFLGLVLVACDSHGRDEEASSEPEHLETAVPITQDPPDITQSTESLA
ncbi:protein unc-93 homolog A-like [Haliotis cracherodii]|uniref:protein unc-93 homolog A-like n=1 Tax=Haliotis cracherodii TaxID=6455 RepID=UPI0039E7E49B